VAYYNPRKWVAQDDDLLEAVEKEVKADKKATPKREKAGKSFLPPCSLELNIVNTDTREVLRLVEWIEKDDRVFIELSPADGESHLRKGHFNNPEDEWHHNPNSRNIHPPHHIHFPTAKYPNLSMQHTYAHPVEARCDYLGAFAGFCDCVNIRYEGVSIPLLRR